ncbi:MlaD family protein [Nocardia blacklockiae]|uniref:MlaD family protein n=1 Tax=Nocardia blacklockiae TaxID=480036 RepID=UPI0018961AC8|nr:MlaD family protein [Nocardia blacklockiae]MBF6171898.1 MCE family protein [Nocardia blacklockiae]
MTERPHTSQRVLARALLALALVLTAAGCDFQPADVPVPGVGVDGPTYRLRIEFANVLNLPQGAKVIADGVRVGQLGKVTVVDPNTHGGKGFVVAEVDIRDSVRLPVGTTAELRQETPLGDVHIALTEPAAPAAARLEPGATIPLANTTQSPPIEDILAGLSTFVGSGAVTDVRDIVRKMNAIMPKDPRDTARLAGILGADLTDLGGRLDSVDHVLDGLQATVTDGLAANTPYLDELLTPYGVQQTTDSVNAQIGVILVLTALGPMGPAAAWLGPLLQSTDGAVRALVPMLFGNHPFDTGSPSNMKKLVELINTKLVPFADRGPKVDLVEVTAAPMSPPERTDRIVDTLRMIGVVR